MSYLYTQSDYTQGLCCNMCVRVGELGADARSIVCRNKQASFHKVALNHIKYTDAKAFGMWISYIYSTISGPGGHVDDVVSNNARRTYGYVLAKNTKGPFLFYINNKINVLSQNCLWGDQ